ncbi:MAG TPA: diguanylate cyclase [Steroidobacteraceae bacterium]|nr:diguanylate cyclase [Steroidobacteraceae bacterium]
MAGNPFDEQLEQLTDEEKKQNPFLEGAFQIRAAEEAALKTSFNVGGNVSPDHAAAILKISRETGAPEGLVTRRYDTFRRQVDSDQAHRDAKDTRTLADWLGNPTNAAVAHDDVPTLAGMERSLTLGSKATKPSPEAQRLSRLLGQLPLSDLTAQMVSAAASQSTPTADLITPGNIDLFAQPRVRNADGSISTVDSIGVELDGKEVLLPTVTPDGRHFVGDPQVVQQQAVDEYRKTGQHLGIFRTAAASDAYAERLHRQYAAGVYDQPDPMKEPAALRVPANIARSTGAGLIGGGYGNIAGAVQMLADVYSEARRDIGDVFAHIRSFPSIAFQGWAPPAAPQKTTIGELAKREAERGERVAQALGPPPAKYGYVEQQVYSGFESVGANLPGMVAGVLTANPELGLGLMGASSTGGAYRQARKEGLDVYEAAAFGGLQGTIEVATEGLPMHYFVEDLTHNAPLRKLIVHQLATELPGEEIATLLQDLVEWGELPSNKDKTFADYLWARPERAVATAISTIVMIGTSSIGGHAAKAVFDRLGADAQNSNTLKRDPASVDALMTQAGIATGVTHVYAPTETFTTFYQEQGIDPRAKATELTGDPTAYDRAVDQGQDLPIPIGAYVTKIASDPVANAFFSNEFRLDPSEQNRRERLASREAMTEAAAAGTKTADADKNEPVRLAIRDQLEASGYTPEVADFQSRFFLRVFTRLAAREKVNAADLFARYGLRIERPDLQAPELREALERVRTAAAEGRTDHLQDLAKHPDKQVAAAAEAALKVMQAQGTDIAGAQVATSMKDESIERLREVASSSDPVQAEAARNELTTREMLPPTPTIEPGAPVGETVAAEAPPAAETIPPAPTGLSPEVEAYVAAIRARAEQAEAARAAAERETAQERGERRKEERRAMTDPLTGLGSRRAYDAALKSVEADPNMAVIVFDGNNFGAVNKVAQNLGGGQEAGDAIIKAGADAVKQAATEFGYGARVFRRGGDEFVVFAPHEFKEAIRLRAEQLFTPREFTKENGDTFEVSLSGSHGNTFAEADAILQAAKAERKAQYAPRPPASRPTDRLRISRESGVPPSRPRERETPAGRERRKSQHLDAVFDELLGYARELDPTVDPAALRAEFDYRINALEEREAAVRGDDVPTPRGLLEAVAKLGGIGDDPTFPGELKWLKEGQTFGRVQGVRGVFQKTTQDARGVRQTGHSLDGMLELLRQDPRFAGLQNINHLIDAIDDAIRHPLEDEGGTFPSTAEYAADLQMWPDETWWEDSWQRQPAAAELAAAAPEGMLEQRRPRKQPSLRRGQTVQQNIYGDQRWHVVNARGEWGRQSYATEAEARAAMLEPPRAPKTGEGEPYETAAVHITTPGGLAGIRATGFDVARGGGLGGDTYGPGIYLADRSSDAASFWREQLRTREASGEIETTALPAQVRLQNALVVEDMRPVGGRYGGDLMRQLDRRDIVAKQMPDQLARFDELVKQHDGSENQALGQLARENGYDGLVFERRLGTEIIAFDPKSVTFEGVTPPAAEDVLPTGEVQPRLPGAEPVREQEIATPQVAEAQFALTPPPAKPTTPDQGTLFQMADAATAVENVAALDAMLPVAREGNFPKRRDLKVHMQELVRQAAKEAGASVDPSTPEGHAYLVGIALRDVLTSLGSNPNAVGWYDEKTQQALAVAALIHPELEHDENARFAFTYALAIHSNGLPVNQNFQIADAAYEVYRKTGQMPSNLGIGAARQQIRQAAELFNERVQQWGLDTFRKFMLSEFTVSELRRLGEDVNGEAASAVVRGAAVIGPKIGNGFFSNLNGFFDALTMDRWLMRTWGRWTGTLLFDNEALVRKKRGELRDSVRQLLARAPAQARVFGEAVGINLATVRKPKDIDALGHAIRKASADPNVRAVMAGTSWGDAVRRHGNMLGAHLDGQKEAPANPVERSQIRAVFSDVLAELQHLGYTGMTTADLQALLWYAEKRLYDAGTSENEVAQGYEDSEAPDYANAASALARSKGISDDEINATLARVTQSTGRADDRAGVSGRAVPAAEAAEPGAGPAGQAVGRGFAPAEREAFLARYAKAPHHGAVHLTPTLEREARAEPARIPGSSNLGTFFQSLLDAVDEQTGAPFYSRLQRAVETSQQAKASGAQWKATIKNAKVGINRDEYALTRVEDLEDGKTYTKQEVLDYLKQNAVQVETRVLGEQAGPSKEAIHQRRQAIYEGWVDEKVQEIEEYRGGPPELPTPETDVGYNKDEGGWEAAVDGDDLGFIYDSQEEAQQAADAEAQKRLEKDEQDLREALRDHAQSLLPPDAWDEALTQAEQELGADQAGSRYGEYVEPGGEPGSYREVFLTAPEAAATDNGQQWQDGHEEYGDIENPIVRLRYNIRTTADGQRVLFLEEVQPPHEDEQKRMPELFRKNWREMAFKYALRIAAEQGLDGVTWTRGEQQAQRYRLEQVVQKIDWTPLTEQEHGLEGKHVIINTRRGLMGLIVEPNGRIADTRAQAPDDWVGRSLADVIGKELASQVVEGEARGEISGEGLKIGGEGLKKLYDVDFRNVVNSLPAVKRSGAKVERLIVSELGTEGRITKQLDELHEEMQRERAYGRMTESMENVYQRRERELMASLAVAGLEGERETNQGVMFTPELREAVMGGQTLFQREGDEGEAGAAAPPAEGAAPTAPPPGQTARGGYSRLASGRLIQLFEQANFSTFLHETAHFYFDVMADLAARPDASPELQRDMATIFKWIGHEGDIHAWQALSLNEQREGHEKFADGFNAYLMEGKAPSLQMQTIFDRFRGWLLDIYKAVEALGVNLTPDVRDVFDRMIATDQEVADAEQARDVPPLFLTPEQAGVSRERFEHYRQKLEDASRQSRERLEKKALEDVRRRQTAEWQARRATTETQVRSELATQPAYIALTAMQRGTTPEGAPLVEGLEVRPQKLSRKLLAERFGEERVKQLREIPGPLIYTRDEQGLDPDLLAELYGFSSTDEMLKAVQAVLPYEQAVTAETDRRMKAQYGEQPVENQLTDASRAALMHDSREEIIRDELRMLAQLRQRNARGEARADLAQQRANQAYERRWFEAEARLRIAIAEGRKQSEIDTLRDQLRTLKGEARGGAARINAALPSAKEIRSYAQATINGMLVRDIRPDIYWAAARKAGKAAVDHAARQNFDEAIKAKQQELLNTALYREATRVLEEVNARALAARDLGRGPARARLGLAGETYLDQVDGILDRYEFARVSNKVLERRASIRAWVAAMQGENMPVELPELVLEEAHRKNYRELTVEQFMAVTDGLAQIAHLAQLKNKLLTAKKQRDFQTTRDGIVDHIEQHGKARPKPIAIRISDAPARKVGEWIASHTKLAEFIARLDGYVQGGPMWTAIMKPLNEAATRAAVIQERAAQRLSEILTTAYSGAEVAALRGPSAKQKALGLGKDTLLFIPAINASLTKEERLAVALNWGNAGNRQRLMESGRNWNETQVQAILNTLDERDLKFVQDTLDYINSFWPQIEAQDRRLKGLPPDKVEPASWVHPQFGEQRGGYYPIAYDGRLSVRADQLINAGEANLQAHAAYAYATTRHGYTKERQAKVNQPVRLELSVMYEHLEQIIHSLSHREVMIDVGRLLADRKIQDAIVSREGDLGYKAMRDNLLDIALGTQHATNIVDRAMTYLRNGGTLAGLGWNVWTAVQQPIGILNGAVINGPVWQARGLMRFLRDTSTMEWSSQWVYAKSEMMRLRGQTANRDIAEMRNSLTRSGSWFDNILRTVSGDRLEREDITNSYLALIELGQKMADIPTWIGAYERHRSAGETEERATALADQAVLDAQSGGQMKDLAKVQRGSPAFKLFTMFYSYGNLMFNQTVRVYGRDWVHGGSVGQMLGNLSLLYIAPAALTVALAKAFGKGDDKEPWYLAMGKEVLATAMNMMVWVREFGPLATGRTGGRGYEGPSGTRFVSSVYKLGQQIEQGKADRGLVRATEDVASILFKLPLGQVQRSIDGFVAIQEGKTKNPLVILTGAPAKKKAS